VRRTRGYLFEPPTSIASLPPAADVDRAGAGLLRPRTVDPLIYRLHEITQVYGTTMKSVIHEMFGDGIMSAIDFEIDIQRVPDPKGDRVQITYNGSSFPIGSGERTIGPGRSGLHLSPARNRPFAGCVTGDAR
jgi:hypothetical protein